MNSSEKLQVPTLLIWAANDTALGPQLAVQIPQFVEDLELHILDDCSHWAQQDRYAVRHTALLARDPPSPTVGIMPSL